MINRNEELTSSRISTFNHIGYKNKYDSLYGHMFIEDLSFDFDIKLSSSINNRGFRIANDGGLAAILENSEHNFLRYEFSKLLQQNMIELILNGKCFLEVVLLKNAEEQVKGLSFVPIKNYFSLPGINKIYFFSKNHNNKYVIWKIKKQLVLKLDLNDLNMDRNYFQKIIKTLKRMSLRPDLEDIQRFNINVKEYYKRQKVRALKAIGNIYWNMRDHSNEYVNFNEPYLLYRLVFFKRYRHMWFSYLLKKYNALLKQLGDIYVFSGTIEPDFVYNDHLRELDDLLSGKINCKTFGDYFKHS